MSSSTHWMNAVLKKVGAESEASACLSGDVTLMEAWACATEALGDESTRVADAVADHFHLPRADLQDLDPKALKLVPESIARQFHVFPLREDYRRLVIASADPANLDAEQAVSFASGRGVSLEVASPDEIEEALIAHFSPDKAVSQILDRVGSDVGQGVELIEDEEEDETVQNLEASAQGPVVDLTNVILREAVEAGASDIHLQPGQHGGKIRYRIDGVLQTTGNMPLPVLSRVVSRIKIMAKLDIADRLRPQDGRARIAFGGRKVDLRISTVPTRNTEKVVIRLLDPQQSRSLEETGLLDLELARFKHLLSHREGIVVVTGPTGSGKTTSLYAALQHIHNDDINIMTVEDPVEYELPGLTQIQVETKQGVTFASALRAILRQDPDILFVGEIRDAETAKIAAEASLTGHLVLSTLHTNDAAGTVGRFLDLGLDAHTLGGTLRGALAQRLVRKICPACSEDVGDELTDEEARLAEEYGVRPLVRPAGCPECSDTGYRGRMPLVEVMTITPEVRELVAEGADSGSITKAARVGGFRGLREVGCIRVAQGETSLQELERVLGDVGGGDRVPVSPESEGAASVGSVSEPAPEEEDGTRILLVDDDGSNRTIARALLEVEDYKVEEAKDGVEAMETLKKGGHFSLVILDLDMPRKNGREVLKEIRGNMATVGLPVIVLTGSTHAETEWEVMDEGADDYIRKPFDPRRFTTRVKAALRRAGA
jgi:type IV pilus assembly protein PilB